MPNVEEYFRREIGKSPQSQDALNVRRRNLQELDMYENPGTEFYDSYYKRAIPFSDSIKRQLPREPGSYEVHKRLLENAPELYQGHSNLTGNIDQYFNPKAQIHNTSREPEFFNWKQSPYYYAEAGVFPNKPESMYISPRNVVTGTSSLLGHEMGHTGHLGLERRAAMLQQLNQQPEAKVYGWQPMFSEDFQKRASLEVEKQTSPYWKKHGFGTIVDETFAFLLGREAELPQGQSLLDDPATAKLFKSDPRMYEEYIRARDKVRSSWQDKKR